MQKVPIGRLLPGAKPVGDGINGALRSIVRCPAGNILAITKFLPEREIAVEVICAVLGQALGLPVPDPILVFDETGTPAFGSLDKGYPSLLHYVKMNGKVAITSKLAQWTDLTPTACFDEWIINHDRHAGNLLFDGESFFLIDHGLALPDGFDSALPAKKNILMDVLTDGKDEVSLQRIKQDVITQPIMYAGKSGDVATAIDGLAVVSPYKNNLLDFVERRIQYLTDILVGRIRTRQTDFINGAQ